MSFGGGSKVGLSRDASLVNLDLAWRERLAEAAALTPTHHATAIGLRIYALEIGLKVLICRRLGLTHLPNHCKTHDLDEIIIFAGESARLLGPANRPFRDNWLALADFSQRRLNDLRYAPNAAMSVLDRDRLLEALDDPLDGVWTWVSSRL